MGTYSKLKNTPIKEIIFTISFKENIEIELLNSFKSHKKISESFPIVNEGFNTLINTANQTPTAKVISDGYVLRSEEIESKILQARQGSMSLHKINGYESYESLTILFKEYYNLLEECCGKLTVNGISVRYLNFIELLDGENVNDLLTIIVNHPFGNEVKNSFTQHKFNYETKPETVVTIVSATGKDNGKYGIVLDIILNKSIVWNNNLSFDFDYFNDLREIKNDLFFKSITEKTINKYN